MQNVSIRNTTVREKHWLENVGPFAEGEKRRDRNDLRLGKSWKIKVVWNFRFFPVVVHVENDHLYSTENRIKVARSWRQGCYLRKFFGSPSHISRSQLIDKLLVSRCSKLDFASKWTRLSFEFPEKCLFVCFYQQEFFAYGWRTHVLFSFQKRKWAGNSVIHSLEVGISFRHPCGLLF